MVCATPSTDDHLGIAEHPAPSRVDLGLWPEEFDIDLLAHSEDHEHRYERQCDLTAPPPYGEIDPSSGQSPEGCSSKDHPSQGREEDHGRVVAKRSGVVAEGDGPDRTCHSTRRPHDAHEVQRPMNTDRWEPECCQSDGSERTGAEPPDPAGVGITISHGHDYG